MHLHTENNTFFFLSDIKECDTFPCKNNAQCLELPGGYECVCLKGYTGVNCEKGIIVQTQHFIIFTE